PANYMRYIWPMNNYYLSADSSMRYCIVAYDSLYDVMNDTAYVNDSIANLAVDSLVLMLGQENNSGADDTLMVKIIGVDTVRGYPLPSTIYWSDMIIIPAGSPLTGNWRTTTALRLAPYTSINYNRFAVMVEYYGNLQDTLGIVAGFGYRDTCGTLTDPPDTTHFSRIRKQSAGDHFLANSFALWSQYQFIGALPTPNGSNIYFDCNSNGQYDGGSDGESYIQNIQFIAHVKTDAAGIHEENSTGISLSQNNPNPFNTYTQFNYSLTGPGNVSLSISDITGRTVFAKDLGKQMPGAHQFMLDETSLEAGVYYYRICTSKGSVTKKMVVER
ncbi:MAG TPA: T9SS type A sorting domain-containing protein, partial [Bacteroidia bacterium]